MSETSTTDSATRSVRPWMVRLGAVLLAAIANGVVWSVSQAAGVDLTVQPPGQEAMVVGLPLTIGFTFVTGLVAWGVLALLERLAPRRAFAIWLVVAVVVFLLFLIPPLSADASTGAVVTLNLLHLVEAVILVVGFRMSRR